MPAIWRPNVRVTLNEDGEVEDTEQEGEEVTKKGTKRKRAPRTKGPCEHGVKYRSNCKVCSACPHGKWRTRCKECGGHQSASTVVGALYARSAGRNLRAWPSALSGKECGGLICEHGRERSECKECGGSQSEHGRVSALRARSAVGQESASTVVSALTARSAVGLICEHGRIRSKCKECGGSICEITAARRKVRWGGICEHARLRSTCKECGGGSICEHGRIRSRCKECRAVKTET